MPISPPPPNHPLSTFNIIIIIMAFLFKVSGYLQIAVDRAFSRTPSPSPTTDSDNGRDGLFHTSAPAATLHSEGQDECPPAGIESEDSDSEISDDGSPFRLRGNTPANIVATSSTSLSSRKNSVKTKGKQICSAFNSAKGCPAPKCMLDHRCTACASDKHSVTQCLAKPQ
ncbi:uncharacterized protein SCHCODRAFT_01216606 [Schizophyllum commune H4-8]|nr:uncharacterized protein SCHCODRAFT_01216606 [Schizophyllum commune H4-8]KAI5887093.1 hypothetical protein SCHCODRAFT_01216606 [Schizophyllum commune H4-8]